MQWPFRLPVAGLNTDTLGYRAKLGVVVPTTNTTVQPELEAMRPPGVTHHVSRMFLPPRPYANMDEYKRALESEGDKLHEAIDLLLPAEPAAIVEGHSIHSFRRDVAHGLDAQQTLSDYCKVPVWIPSVSILRALEAIGNPRRIAILTPYWPPADDMIANWFRSGGYHVTKAEGMKATGPTNVSRITPDQIYAGFRMVDTPDTEVLIHVGTALPVSGLTERIERDHGKPLIGVNVATYWAALRSIGIQDRIKGFGMLVANH